MRMKQKSAIKTITEYSDRIVTKLSLSIYVLMMITVGLQVLAREILAPVFGINLSWTLNLSQFLLVYITFFGAAVASGKREHITLDLVTSYLSDRVVRVMTSIQMLLILTFGVIMIGGAYQLYQLNQGSTIGTLPPYPPFTEAGLYIPVIVGGIFIILYRLRDLWLLVRHPEKIIDDIKRDETEEQYE